MATRRVLDFIARQQSISGDWCKGGTALRLAQRVSITLHQENARAIQRRLRPAEEEASRPLEIPSGDEWEALP